VPNDLIERVARALTDHWENLEEKQRNYFYQKARAAIEAMREPTEAMIAREDDDGRAMVIEIWQAMIDAALGRAQ
jgi:hypothetical protein